MLLPAPHGQLEAHLREASRPAGGPVAVVCHPHPLHGGTMRTKAVHATCKGLVDAGVPNLTFNFRGVGLSTGVYDGGIGEREDLRVALDHLGERFPDAPILVAGFSFGSWVGLTVGAADSRVVGLLGLAPPFARYDFAAVLATPKPKVILQGEDDDLAPLSDCELAFAAMPQPKLLCTFEATGHLFLESLPALRETVAEVARAWPPRGGRVRRRPAREE